MSKYIFQDWAINSSNPKARLILVLFRTAQLLRGIDKPLYYFCIPYLIFYRVLVEWVLGVELPWNLKLGANARLFHGMGLVVNDQVQIGSHVILRHNTTIGVKGTLEFGNLAVPVIGNHVDIGSNVVILGDVKVGDRAVIGAGSVVVKDVPKGAVVVGNPARIIKVINDE